MKWIKRLFRKQTNEEKAHTHAMLALVFWSKAWKEKELQPYSVQVYESGLYVELGKKD